MNENQTEGSAGVSYQDNDGDECAYTVNEVGQVELWVNGLKLGAVRTLQYDADRQLLRDDLGGSSTIPAGERTRVVTDLMRLTQGLPSINIVGFPKRVPEQSRQVLFVDTDGDECLFLVNSSGQLEAWVNGLPNTIITRLTYDGAGRLTDDGGASTIPSIERARVTRELRQLVHGLQGVHTRGLPTELEPAPFNDNLQVRFTDTDGDECLFFVNGAGHLEAWCNGEPNAVVSYLHYYCETGRLDDNGGRSVIPTEERPRVVHELRALTSHVPGLTVVGLDDEISGLDTSTIMSPDAAVMSALMQGVSIAAGTDDLCVLSDSEESFVQVDKDTDDSPLLHPLPVTMDGSSFVLTDHSSSPDVSVLPPSADPSPGIARVGPSPDRAGPTPDGGDGPAAEAEKMPTCCMCMDSVVNAVFIPCGHLACCHECAQMVDKCAICRTAVASVVRTYTA